MLGGWVCLHRKFLDWEWYDDQNVVRLFLHCLLKANFEDKKWRGIEIKRGTFITSRDVLSAETGLSVSQVRTSIKKLKSTGEIASNGTPQHTVITVNNYDQYQDRDQQSSQPVANESPASSQRIATTNKINNNNNKNIVHLEPTFDDFWSVYPRREAKKKAQSSWKQLTKQNKHLAIADVKTRFEGVDRQYIPLPTTYLNGERWADEKPKAKNESDSIKGWE